jgi:dTDP-4-amino-4,6-dideoxygalactose transaminase
MDLFKPSVPPLESYIDDLRIMDQNGWYSNFGPFYHQFRDGLAAHFKCTPPNIELFCSGTMALTAGLAALKIENKPYCILPSWTFVASAQAVIAAGLTPYFIDVDFETMQVTENELAAVPEAILKKTSAILVVAPFGAPIKDLGLSTFSKKHGIEILVDAAAGFESYKYQSFNTMISLHATKTFGIGEGGLLISSNSQFIERAHQFSNFGFTYGNRTSDAIGVNGKISEMASVVGLAALKNWPTLRQNYYDKAKVYIDSKTTNIFEFMNGWGREWISSTCIVRFKSEKDKKETIQNFKENNISNRDWWNRGCHCEKAFKLTSKFSSMQNTNELTNKTLGIPFNLKILNEEIIFLFDSLKFK